MKEHYIFRATQVKQDSVKKQADCSNNITKYEAKYREKCAEIGIVGDHIKSELSGLVLGIPDLMTEISRSLGHIQPAISYYQVPIVTSHTCLDLFIIDNLNFKMWLMLINLIRSF